MAITYNNEIETIYAALYSLINSEFTELNVRNFPAFDSAFLGRNNEYIRFFYLSDDHVGTTSDGEVRDFSYGVSYYLRYSGNDARNTFEDKLADRTERIRKLVGQAKTYQPSSVYKWHDLVMTRREWVSNDELIDGADVLEVRMKLTIKRTCTW